MSPQINAPADYIKRVFDLRQDVFARLAKKDKSRLWLKASLEDVKKAVIISSASRSGSSLLYAILKKIPRIYSLSGEAVPFYKLNGFSSDICLSDEIPIELTKRNNHNLSRDFLSDFSLVLQENSISDDDRLLDGYLDDLVLRFSMQWPQITFSYDTFRDLAQGAFRKYTSSHQKFCKEDFYLELFRTLRATYPAINPYYYDIPQDLVKNNFPQITVPAGPPNDISAIEEPPFILLSPQDKPDKDSLDDKILLLKSQLDCYSMPFIKALLPNADIKIIYLTRNPMGSINGLYDGWLSRGFFSHNLRGLLSSGQTKVRSLNIQGYSDKYEWGKWWWKYDLPPGWQDYAEKRLEEVCAFQWCAANQAIQDYLRADDITQCCRIRYENIIGSSGSRLSEIEKIFAFLGLDNRGINHLDLDKLPVIQATLPPVPYRWKARQEILLPLLDTPQVVRMSDTLGYKKENIKEWL
jgi:hypothetical protein